MAGIKSLKTLSMLMPYSRDINNIILLLMSLLTVVIVFNLILNCQYINECKNMTLTEHISLNIEKNHDTVYIDI